MSDQQKQMIWIIFDHLIRIRISIFKNISLNWLVDWFFVNLSKTVSPNRNTLDSFVIKQESSQYFEEPILKNENKKTSKKPSAKRVQSTIEDYMFKDTKSSGKRFKK